MKAHEEIPAKMIKHLIAAPLGMTVRQGKGEHTYYNDVVAIAVIEDKDGGAQFVGIQNEGDFLSVVYDGSFCHEHPDETFYVTGTEKSRPQSLAEVIKEGNEVISEAISVLKEQEVTI